MATKPTVTIHFYDFTMETTDDGDTVDVEQDRSSETLDCTSVAEFTGDLDGTPVFLQRESPVRRAVQAIRREYLTTEPGTRWFFSPDGPQDHDLSTGVMRETTAHLSGFTPAQERAIFRIIARPY